MFVRDAAFDRALAEHLATWGPNCGAPQAVYAGHLRILLDAAQTAEREACADLAASMGEHLGYEVADAIRYRVAHGGA